MLDALPLFQSMKRDHRVRRFRPGNREHRSWRGRKGPRHRPTRIIHTEENIAA